MDAPGLSVARPFGVRRVLAVLATLGILLVAVHGPLDALARARPRQRPSLGSAP